MATSPHKTVRAHANILLDALVGVTGLVDSGQEYYNLAEKCVPVGWVGPALLHTFGRGWVRIDPAHRLSHPTRDGAVVVTRQGWVHWHALKTGVVIGACRWPSCAVCHPITCMACDFTAGHDETARRMAHVDDTHTLIA